MLRLIPPRLHRLAYRAAFALRRRWLRWRGGTIYGCSVIARDGDGRLLAVRHSYGRKGWEFPGGGRPPGEDPEAAALREFAEETGCSLAGPVHLGRVEEGYHGAANVVDVFTGLAVGEPRADGREIVEVRFFDPAALRAAGSATVRRRLDMLDKARG